MLSHLIYVMRVFMSLGDRRGAYRVLLGRPEGKRPLIKMDFQEVGWGGIDWTDLAEDRDR
jgi:hypothetical protein